MWFCPMGSRARFGPSKRPYATVTAEWSGFVASRSTSPSIYYSKNNFLITSTNFVYWQRPCRQWSGLRPRLMNMLFLINVGPATPAVTSPRASPMVGCFRCIPRTRIEPEQLGVWRPSASKNCCWNCVFVGPMGFTGGGICGLSRPRTLNIKSINGFFLERIYTSSNSSRRAFGKTAKCSNSSSTARRR